MNSSTERPDAHEGTCGFTTHLDILREVPLFVGMPLDVLKVLAYLSGSESFRAGDNLCVQGEVFDSCRYVMLGHVEILRAAAGGGPALMREAGKGWAFGGLSLLTHHATSLYTIRAKDDVDCLVLSREKFQKSAERFPQILPRVLTAVVDHMFAWEAKVLTSLEHGAGKPLDIDGLTLF
jgi:CRP-like cAMP-binding protein